MFFFSAGGSQSTSNVEEATDELEDACLEDAGRGRRTRKQTRN